MIIRRDILKRMMSMNGGWVNKTNGHMLFQMPNSIVRINSENEIMDMDTDISAEKGELIAVPRVRLEYVFQRFLKRYKPDFSKDISMQDVLKYADSILIPKYRNTPFTGDGKYLFMLCEFMHDIFETRAEIRELYESFDVMDEIADDWARENQVALGE